MLTQLRKLLAPPVFKDDEDQTGIAAQLYNTTLIGIAVTLIYALAWLVIAPNQLERLLFVPPVLGLFILVLALIRAARVRLASLLFTIGSWILVTLIVAIAGGVRAPFYGMYTLIVLGAALYLGWRLAPVVGSCTMIVGLGMVHLANLGLISSPLATPLVAWLTQSAIMIFITAQAYVVTHNIHHALARASKEIAERKQVEEALQRSRIELEQHNASLRIINEIAEKLHRSLDLQQIADEAVDSLVNYSQSPMVAFFLLDKSESRLKSLAHYGFNSVTLAVGSSLPLQGSLSGLTVSRKEVVTSEEIREDQRVEPAVRQALVSQGLHSGVSIPILFEEEVLGVVNLIFAEKYIMSDYQRETLISIGKTIGLAVANARHVNQIETEIEERKRAEDELRDSEERFRSLSQAAFEGIMIHEDGVILAANAAFANLFGYPDAKDLIGKNGLEILSFSPESREKLRQIIPLNSSQLYEIQVVRPDGTTVPAETQGRGIVYRGQQARIVAMRDITERRRAERVQEALYSISQAAVSTENLPDLYHSIHHTLGQLMSVENFYIALYNSTTDMISYPYFVDERDQSPLPRKLSRGLTEYVLRTGRPLLADPDVFARLIQQGEVELMGADSVDWLGVPLKIGTRVVGVLVVQSYVEGIRYSHAERELLEFVSTQVAAVIERKRAEEALRESEEQYRTLVETSPDAIALIALDGKILTCNQRAVDLWDYDSIAEVLSANAFSLIVPPDRERAKRDLDKGLQGAENREVQYTFLKKDGTPFIGELSANLLRDLNGTPKSFVAITRDITDRKQAEEALQRYAARIEILHEIDQAILAAKSLHEIAHATLSRTQRLVPSWRAQIILFDFNADEAFSVAAYENGNVAPLGPRVKLETLDLPEALRPGELYVVEDLSQLQLPSPRDQLLISQGSRAHIAAPLIATGKMIGYLTFDSKQPNMFRGTVIDIVREIADQLAIAIQSAHLLEQTQLHAQELEVQTNALSRALEQQRELDRLQREFIQIVSHELRTPLALVLGHAELLESGESGDLLPSQQESINVIARRTRMLRTLVDEVIAALETENRPLKEELVDLGRLVKTLLADFQSAAQHAHLMLSSEIAPDLPPIRGDEMALHRALDNLMGNAFKFTPAGGRVDVRLTRSEQTLVLEVTDTGVGIPSDQLPHIFKRFYQANGGTTRRFGGLGLGLALVKEIVDRHHGRIEVESQVGAGTAFRVWFSLNS